MPAFEILSDDSPKEDSSSRDSSFSNDTDKLSFTEENEFNELRIIKQSQDTLSMPVLP